MGGDEGAPGLGAALREDAGAHGGDEGAPGMEEGAPGRKNQGADGLGSLLSPWRAGSIPPNHPNLHQGQGVAQDGGARHLHRLLPGWWLEPHIPIPPGHRGDTDTARMSQHGVTGTRGVPSCPWAPISSQAPLSPWGPSRPCTRGALPLPPLLRGSSPSPAPTSTRPHHRRAVGRTGRRQGVRGREQHPPQGGQDPPRHPSLCPGRGPPRGAEPNLGPPSEEGVGGCPVPPP